jgi:hypothetical protein
MQECMQVFGHDDERVDGNHRVMSGNAGKQFFAHHVPYLGLRHVWRIGAAVRLFQGALYVA